MGAPNRSQTWGVPSWQRAQMPQPKRHAVTTRSPWRKLVTPSPASTTSATASWPIGVPPGTSGISSTMWMSLPQMVERRVRTSACPGPGLGISSAVIVTFPVSTLMQLWLVAMAVSWIGFGRWDVDVVDSLSAGSAGFRRPKHVRDPDAQHVQQEERPRHQHLRGDVGSGGQHGGDDEDDDDGVARAADQHAMVDHAEPRQEEGHDRHLEGDAEGEQHAGRERESILLMRICGATPMLAYSWRKNA